MAGAATAAPACFSRHTHTLSSPNALDELVGSHHPDAFQDAQGQEILVLRDDVRSLANKRTGDDLVVLGIVICIYCLLSGGILIALDFAAMIVLHLLPFPYCREPDRPEGNAARRDSQRVGYAGTGASRR